MTREEAVKFAEHAVNITDIPEVKEFYRMPLPLSPCPPESRWRRCGESGYTPTQPTTFGQRFGSAHIAGSRMATETALIFALPAAHP